MKCLRCGASAEPPACDICGQPLTSKPPDASTRTGLPPASPELDFPPPQIPGASTGTSSYLPGMGAAPGLPPELGSPYLPPPAPG